MSDKNRTDELIEFLNQLIKVDREAITKLIELRVPCNEDLKVHPTVTVTPIEGKSFPRAKVENCEVGLLGLLNGFCGVGPEGYGPICAVFDGEGVLLRFRRAL